MNEVVIFFVFCEKTYPAKISMVMDDGTVFFVPHNNEKKNDWNGEYVREFGICD
jgi:hypothetical protein